MGKLRGQVSGYGSLVSGFIQRAARHCTRVYNAKRGERREGEAMLHASPRKYRRPPPSLSLSL